MKFKNFNFKFYIELFILFFTGFFGLSAFSYVITSNFGLPYLIELFFLPLLFYYYYFNKKFFNSSKNTRSSLIVFAILYIIFSSTVIGILRTGNIFDVVTMIRPLVYMIILIYFLINRKYPISIEKVYYLSFGVLFGELFNKLVVIGDISQIDHINPVALALFIVIPFILKRKKLILFSIIFGFIMGLMTLYRRILLIAIVSIIIGSIHYLRDLSIIKKLIYFPLLISISFLVYNNQITILEFFINILSLDGSDEYYLSATYRMIVKLSSTVNASDFARISHWNEISTEFTNKIIPPGPIGKSIGLHYFGVYTDATNVFLYDVFGSIISWLVVVPVIIKGLITFIIVNIKKSNDKNIELSGLLFPVFLIFLIVDGTFLVHANIAILSSFAFFGWFKKNGNHVENV